MNHNDELILMLKEFFEPHVSTLNGMEYETIQGSLVGMAQLRLFDKSGSKIYDFVNFDPNFCECVADVFNILEIHDREWFDIDFFSMCEIQSDEIDSALYDFLCEKGFVIQTSKQDVCKTYESEFFVEINSEDAQH